jgi:hypothetical protein
MPQADSEAANNFSIAAARLSRLGERLDLGRDEQLDRIWDEFIFVHMEMKPDAIIEDIVKPSGSTKSVLRRPTDLKTAPFS